ncbi:MAG: type IV pilus secretin PilQ [Pseudomonadota bacterium]|nr:MAG: type IV pilus secretin PilQ [Pseudomonadota bacterium]
MATGARAQNVALEDISFSTLPGDRVEIRLSMSGPAPEPGAFTIDTPARIALDFPATENRLKAKSRDIGVGVARSISAVEAGGRTRVVINLARLVGYSTRVSGNDVYVTLQGEGGYAAGAPAAAPATMPAAVSGDVVIGVDFRRGEKGEGRVIVTLADPNTPIDLQRRGNRVVANVPRGKLSGNLERRMDVIDFATPVKTVDAFNFGDGSQIVVGAAGEFDYLGYQTDNRFTIEVKPIIKEEEEERRAKKREYTGERLSLNFQDIEVRAVLQLVADFTGLNLVTSDTVGGNITLRLKNVPWDQALDIILKTKGLAKRENGNVIMVAPADEIAAREKLELEASKQLVQLAPLENETIQVNYAKATTLFALFNSEEGKQAWLSPRGSVTMDERTNRLLVRDTRQYIDAIVAMVEELDIAVRQVLIESRVVLASNDFSKELGVRFGLSRKTDNGQRTTTTSGDLTATNDILNGDPIPAPERWNVNLPVSQLASTAGSIGLAVATLPFGTLLELELSAAQAEGRSETVSSPRVITANQREAVIETGQEIPYLEATSSGAATVAFKKAVLSLRVTPQITPDDRVIMDLKVNKDEADFSRSVLGVPPINTQNVQTQVLVDNGETIVLGGVYEQTKQQNINRVPFFGDLPVIGALFRQKFESDEKSELLIFVTPKIVKEALAL